MPHYLTEAGFWVSVVAVNIAVQLAIAVVSKAVK